jgi:hypothetical protein
MRREKTEGRRQKTEDRILTGEGIQEAECRITEEVSLVYVLWAGGFHSEG